jgi:hypothetical protein
MQEADETFHLGIARGAAPLERLQAKHTAFQKRMMAGALAPAASASTPAPAAAAAPKRRILGDSSKKSSTSTPAPLSAQPAPAPRANAQIAVFVDSDEPASALATNAWPELGTRTARVKENVRAPGPMAGATLKQRRAPAPARSGGFAVFTGPEDEPAPAPAPARKAAEPARKGVKTAKAPEAFVPFTDDAATAEAFVPFMDDDVGDGGFVPFCDEGEDEARTDHVLPRTLPHAHLFHTGASRGTHARARVGHAAQGGGRGPRARERGGGAAEEPAEELPWAGVIDSSPKGPAHNMCTNSRIKRYCYNFGRGLPLENKAPQNCPACGL